MVMRGNGCLLIKLMASKIGNIAINYGDSWYVFYIKLICICACNYLAANFGIANCGALLRTRNRYYTA